MFTLLFPKLSTQYLFIEFPMLQRVIMNLGKLLRPKKLRIKQTKKLTRRHLRIISTSLKKAWMRKQRLRKKEKRKLLGLLDNITSSLMKSVNH
jgi:hypothetical protein